MLTSVGRLALYLCGLRSSVAWSFTGEAEVPVEDANFWHDAFQLRTSETEGEVLCPAILRPLAAAILTAGKSSLLLRVKSAQDGRCSHVPAAAEGTTTASPQLYEDVLQRLKDAVSRCWSFWSYTDTQRLLVLCLWTNTH